MMIIYINPKHNKKNQALQQLSDISIDHQTVIEIITVTMIITIITVIIAIRRNILQQNAFIGVKNQVLTKIIIYIIDLKFRSIKGMETGVTGHYVQTAGLFPQQSSGPAIIVIIIAIVIILLIIAAIFFLTRQPEVPLIKPT